MKENLEQYFDMSPFEIKNILGEKARAAHKKKIEKGEEARLLNAGRGNPNFLNTTVRQAFSYFSLFCANLSDSICDKDDLGFRPEKKGIAEKLKKFMKENIKKEGMAFLQKAIEFAIEKYKFNPDDFVFELVDGNLGDYYPVPSRIFPNTAEVVFNYVKDILGLDPKLEKNDYHFFATEGATGAMYYLFHSLKTNGILKANDKIAIITPIFSPYLEIPILKEFELKEVLIKGDEEKEWQIPDSEFEKLKDPKIKALYLVNPTNPTSVAMNQHALEKIADIVKNHNKELIVLTDTVYATFVDNFHSLITAVPHNTICVYSYSKYFGVTGWRLGIIMLHKDNVIDRKIQRFPKKTKEELHERYKTVTPDTNDIKFIDRLEIDSREPALAHTGGLSGPQQCIMCLFSLFELVDKEKKYKQLIHSILKKRIELLYNKLQIATPEEAGHTYYYTLIDLGKMAEAKHGEEFAKYLRKNFSALEFIFRLAEEHLTICLPGEGFAGPKWSLRVSLANLYDDDYIQVGQNISKVMQKFYDEWKK